MKGKQGAGMGYAMVFVAALMWGTIGIFVKGISGVGVTSQTMAAFRLLAGAVLLAPVLVFMGCRGADCSGAKPGPLALFRADARSLACCALVGIPGLVISNTCYYESMDAVGMSTASVLLYTSPVFGCILGRLLYREGVTPNKLAAIACNIVGCVLTVTDGDLAGFIFLPTASESACSRVFWVPRSPCSAAWRRPVCIRWPSRFGALSLAEGSWRRSPRPGPISRRCYRHSSSACLWVLA